MEEENDLNMGKLVKTLERLGAEFRGQINNRFLTPPEIVLGMVAHCVNISDWLNLKTHENNPIWAR